MGNDEHLISRLEFQRLRDVFRDEARHFTIWLEEHLEVLGERLGIELNIVQREKEVGDFNVDLLCEDSQGRKVIIENQLERTDHDHLGKLLTYLVNLDASAAIWLTGEPRPEHQKVIDWLNENTGWTSRSSWLKSKQFGLALHPPPLSSRSFRALTNRSRNLGRRRRSGRTAKSSRLSSGRGYWRRAKRGRSFLLQSRLPRRTGSGLGLAEAVAHSIMSY